MILLNKFSDLRKGKKQIFAGFLHVYQEGNDDAQSDTEEQILPDLQEWQKLILQNIRGDQHFTEAPPRYTEASLVKKMEAEEKAKEEAAAKAAKKE